MAQATRNIDKLNLIVAFDKNYGIGLKGKLPWPRLETDSLYFQEKTTITLDPNKRNVLISGRLTWESIPLRARKNIYNKCFRVVLSTTFENVEEADITSSSLKKAMDTLSAHPDYNYFESFWIIGGSKTYQEALDSSCCLKLYTTVLNQSFECDTFFPLINWSNWEEIKDPSLGIPNTVEKNISYQFKIYTRIHHIH
ncbi:Dihydrofolate reductase-like isoform X1 [Oopsacas minuta]|uniref:dihydrofolate reductase n=1 Tax=Oopsacas minuta TaxID=111878 RepID=A0AAV7JE39_9METZ|nr:Dihydrofolate reductase-like isoform X1 [Oopsacas minuta]